MTPFIFYDYLYDDGDERHHRRRQRVARACVEGEARGEVTTIKPAERQLIYVHTGYKTREGPFIILKTDYPLHVVIVLPLHIILIYIVYGVVIFITGKILFPSHYGRYYYCHYVYYTGQSIKKNIYKIKKSPNTPGLE